MVLISVIIPVYNASRTINSLLESIKRQKARRDSYEIIIINDGSTDNSEEIIKSFIRNNKNLNIKYKKQVNQGCPSSRNNGLKMSSGRYILSIDSDQELGNNVIKECLKFINEGEKMAAIEEYGTGRNIVSRLVEYERRINFYKTKRDIPRFYATDILKEIGGWNKDLWLGEDFDVYQRLVAKGYNISILKNCIIKHHEINSIRGLIKKYFIYGKSAKNILKIHNKNATKMYLGMNRRLIYNLLYFLIRNPILWFGAMFIKFLRYGATITGMIDVKLKEGF